GRVGAAVPNRGCEARAGPWDAGRSGRDPRVVLGDAAGPGMASPGAVPDLGSVRSAARAARRRAVVLRADGRRDRAVDGRGPHHVVRVASPGSRRQHTSGRRSRRRGVAPRLGVDPPHLASARAGIGAAAMTRTGGEARRRTLVEEATRQFGAKGYDGASLESVASACGVRKQTLLYYFPTKDALFESCVLEVSARVAGKLTEALAEEMEPSRKAETVIHTLFGLAEEWPVFPQFAREAGRMGPEIIQAFAA